MKADRNWIKFKTDLLKTNNVHRIMSDWKDTSSPSLILDWTPLLINLPKVKKFIAPGLVLSSSRNFTDIPPLRLSSFVKELAYSAGLILGHRSLITKWLSYYQNIEKCILSNDLQEAQKELQECENVCGPSIWSLDTNIAILGNLEGLDAQKTYAKKIWNDSTTPDTLRALTYYISQKNEPRVSCWKYDSLISQLIDSNGGQTDPRASTYISFILNFFGPVEFDDLGDLTWRLTSYPIVDQYFYLLRILAIFAGRCDKENKEHEFVRKIVERLAEGIADERLQTILYAYGSTNSFANIPNDKDYWKCIDAYTSGDYSASAQIAASKLNHRSNKFEYIEILAKSIARSGSQVMHKINSKELVNLVNEMIGVLLKDKGADRAVDSLRKKCYTWHGFAIGAQLFGFLHREYLSDGPPSSNRFTNFSDLSSSATNPRLIFSICNNAWRHAFITKIKKSAPDSCTVSLYSFLENGVEDEYLDTVDANRLSLFRARQKLSSNAANAITMIDNINTGHDFLLEQDVKLFRNRALIQLGQLKASIQTMTNIYLEQPIMVNRLPIREVLHKIKQAGLETTLSRELSFCILVHAYNQHFGPFLDFRLENVYEDFLESLEVAKPSELIYHADNINIKELVYFLRYVCVDNVLDNSIAFRSTADLQNERISIYRMLIELDGDHRDLYSEGIKEITQTIVVNRLVQHVEQSGIHVEVPGIKLHLNKSLNESYARYIDLCRECGDHGGRSLILVEIGKALGSEFHLYIPGDERRAVLEDIWIEARDQFVSSNEFGLDGYLSTGVRHGTLAGQLRAPFEELNLITQRDDTTGIYREPIYWLEQLNELSEDQRIRLTTAVQEFSSDIDLLIERTRTQWIQISSEKREGNGIFDFRLKSQIITDLQSKITLQTSYNEYVDLIFESLWIITDNCLENAKRRISNELKTEVTTRVSLLEGRVKEIIQGHNSSQIISRITTARTNAQYAIDRIANWFKRTSTLDMEPYSMDLPIRIAGEMIRNLFPTTILRIESKFEISGNIKFKGGTLKSVVQVLFILLENVKNHSGIVSPETMVWITCNLADDFTIKVENEIGQSLTFTERRQRLDAALAAANFNDRFNLVAKEKGSGFQKIERILRVDLQCDPMLSFHVLEKGIFEAVIVIKPHVLIA